MERLLARIAECERRINWLIEQVRAILRHLRNVEQRLRELGDLPTNFANANSGNGGANVIPAVAGGGGIPAFSGSTAGSATVTLYTLVGLVWTATAQTVTALNLSATAVGASKRLLLASDGTNYWVIWEDCG